jgi:hypothetical protein
MAARLIGRGQIRPGWQFRSYGKHAVHNVLLDFSANLAPFVSNHPNEFIGSVYDSDQAEWACKAIGLHKRLRVKRSAVSGAPLAAVHQRRENSMVEGPSCEGQSRASLLAAVLDGAYAVRALQKFHAPVASQW